MTIDQTALKARLHFLELGSADPERLAAFYGTMFGMAVERRAGGWLCRSRTRRLLIREAQPKALMAAGYAVAGPEALSALSRRAQPHQADGADAWGDLFEGAPLAVKDPDGNTLVFGLAGADVSAAEDDDPPGRLQHVVFGSTGLDRMVEFYTQVVGFRISDTVIDEAGDTKTVFMRSDEEHHSLAVFQTSENRLDHHCYEAPSWNSLRDWGDRLAAHRVPVKWGPGRHGPGNNLFLFFHDPDDNWLEISAELEVVAEDRPVGRWPHEERTLNSWGRGYLRT